MICRVLRSTASHSHDTWTQHVQRDCRREPQIGLRARQHRQAFPVLEDVGTFARYGMKIHLKGPPDTPQTQDRHSSLKRRKTICLFGRVGGQSLYTATHKTAKPKVLERKKMLVFQNNHKMECTNLHIMNTTTQKHELRGGPKRPGAVACPNRRVS